MNRFTFLFLFLLIFPNGFSQNISRDYGKITGKDFETKSFLGDTTKEAIILFDLGKSHFINDPDGFRIYFDRHTRIKILSTAGIEHSEISIPFYHEQNEAEIIKDIEGVTYNLENGTLKKTSLDKKTVYVEKINELWSLKKFAMPEVKPGSVIEFKYRLISPYIFNLKDWDFQSTIPTLFSEYEVRTIPFYDYTYYIQGKNKLSRNSSVVAGGLPNRFAGVEYREMISTFTMLNLPGFEDETFITSINDFIYKIDFQLSKINYPNGVSKEILTSWPELCNGLLKDGAFSKFLNKSEKKTISYIDLAKISNKTDEEKIKLAVDAVKNNFRWNGRNGVFPQNEIKDFLTEQTGNSSNINLFLTSMLRAVGFDAHPVLLSTRDHGKVVKNFPFLHCFNYVVAYVKTDDGYMLIDAADEMCPYNQLPFKCLNGFGLVVKNESEQWIKLNNEKTSVVEKNMNLAFSDADETLIGNFDFTLTDYDAMSFRKNHGDNVSKIKENIESNALTIIDSIQIENINVLEEPFKMGFKAECPFEKIGDKLFISPLLNEPIAENPFKQDSREYPIDMNYKMKRKYTATLKIPEGYQIQKMPESYSADNKWMTINYKIENVADADEIIVSAEYATKQAVYAADDYRNLKYMYNEVIKKFNEKIIFTKNTKI